MSESIVAEKAYRFSLEIVKLYRSLISEKKEYVLSKQVLRSGTSIGANVNEAISAVSKRDFVHILGIALKEARETNYWLRLLKDADLISQTCYHQLGSSCNELIKIFTSIILTIRKKYLQNKDSTHNS